ncbi:DUF2513 domain-containing protein [Pseudomonas sp. DC3000-4b1]|uniref:DUF2513 domain-containing protein n=1 Tax=unclassified Pseudomonas TaxID=196821 RepID=UPI003CF1CA42
MKLDKDLVREILLTLESSMHPAHGTLDLSFEGRTAEVISYHVLLLTEAGFLCSQSQQFLEDKSKIWKPMRLTYKGHEFLETIRDGEVWGLTKKGVEKAGGASLSLMMELGKVYGKQVIKDRLGIELP